MNEKEPRILTNPREIIMDVGRWAVSQPWHPNHAPAMGVGEEIGELCHAILKNFQKIRGFDDEKKFREAVIDAFGDIMVYLSHWCYLNNAYYLVLGKDSVAQSAPMFHRDLHIGHAFICIGRMMLKEDDVRGDGASSYATSLVQRLQCLAHLYELDLIMDCLVPTWNKVRQRNWNKDKMQGGEVKQAPDFVLKPEWFVERGLTPDQFHRKLTELFPKSADEQGFHSDADEDQGEHEEVIRAQRGEED